MNAHNQLVNRIETALDMWAKRHGLTLSHEAKKQLVNYVSDVAIDAGHKDVARALSLAQESVVCPTRGRRCP